MTITIPVHKNVSGLKLGVAVKLSGDVLDFNLENVIFVACEL